MGRRIQSSPGASGTKRALDPAGIAGARQASAPAVLAPQLATLAEEIPAGEGWLYEIKLDGYRLMAHLKRGEVRLLTRRGHDWTRKFPALAATLKQLPVEAILDGELVALDERGLSSFQALQNALDPGGKSVALHFFAFDLPYCNGYDLSAATLLDRKGLLREVLAGLPPDSPVRFSEYIEGKGELAFKHACKQGLEGLIAKRGTAPYESRRSRNWLKIKCIQRQEFVIGGYTDPEGGRGHFGALLLGYYDRKGELRHCGRVGTGFTHTTLKQILAKMKPLETKGTPFVNPPRGTEARGVHWLRPELVGEVAFAQWTGDDNLRHASFQGLRLDKQVRDVKRERAKALEEIAIMPAAKTTNEPSTKPEVKEARPAKSTRSKKHGDAMVAGVKITHPERMLWPEQGLTKLELAQYYEGIAEWIVPHLAGRPLSLVRCPDGPGGECFFQKHLRQSVPAGIRGIEIKEKDEVDTYHILDGIEGIIGLVQMGVLEFHAWGSSEANLEKPDRMIFDLDPAPDVGWPEVVAAARQLKATLEGLGLETFVKSSGGKGLHVVAPLARRAMWVDVREFSEAVARKMAAEEPEKFVAVMTKAKRGGKIFVDYLRNQRGATCVSAFSTRARPGAPVSTPLRWDELTDRIEDVGYTVQTLPARLQKLKKDPWAGFFGARQSLTKAMIKKLG